MTGILMESGLRLGWVTNEKIMYGHTQIVYSWFCGAGRVKTEKRSCDILGGNRIHTTRQCKHCQRPVQHGLQGCHSQNEV